MSNQSPVIEPDVVTAAVEILKIVADPAAMQARLASLSEASAAAKRSIDEAAQAQVALVTARAEHERTLAVLTNRQTSEHEARLKEITVREAKLASGQRDLETELQRISARERQIELRASDLSNRMGHRGVA